MLLLDTDVIIDVQRRHPPAMAWFASLTEVPVVSGFVVMELMQSARNKTELTAAKRLIAPFPVAWPSQADCNLAVQLFENFHLSHRLGLIDSLIAATCIGLGITLCTFNAKHFAPVTSLLVTEPYVR